MKTSSLSSSETNAGPAGAPSAPETLATFAIRDDRGGVDIWMKGRKARPVFFDEWLPACFERTLAFDRREPGGATLEWLFTGPECKVTVSLDAHELRFRQSFHDSFYLNDPGKIYDQNRDADAKRWFQAEMSDFDGINGINIHPEQHWDERTLKLPRSVDSVGLTLRHNMEIAVWVNGEKVIAQNCLADLHHHQLRLVGTEASFGGRLLGGATRSVRLTADKEKRHQIMKGFGGTAIPTAYDELSEAGKAKFWEYVKDYNLHIQRENPIAGELNEAMDNWDELSDAIPHYYGDSFPNGNISDFGLNKEFRRRGAEVWFEFWHFPSWMVHAGETFLDEKGKERPDPVKVEAYAAAIVEYCRQAKAKAGGPPEIVGIQNESSHPKETYHAMVAELRRALDEVGFEAVEVHMSDANMLSAESEWGKLYADSITRAKTFTEKPETWAKIDYAAAHMYDYQQYFADPDAFDRPMRELRELYGDKPFLSTELCVNSPRYQMKSYRLALLMGELMHKNLTLLDASAVLFCWTLLNVEQPNYAWTRSLLTVDRENGFVPVPSSHQLRVYGAWSRCIRKGMTRVALECDDRDLLATLFTGEDGAATLVACNRGSTPAELRIEGIDPTAFRRVETASPYAPNLSRAFEAGKGGALTVEPGAILTLSSL